MLSSSLANEGMGLRYSGGTVMDSCYITNALKVALFLQKGESLGRQQRIAKGLTKLMPNPSEKQGAAQTPLSE